MKKFSVFALITLISCFWGGTLCSCTQNDGDIGPLFGLWSLSGFSEDDMQAPEVICEGHSLRFQSDLVQYIENLPYHDSRMFMGMWQIHEDSLVMRFPDSERQPGAPIKVSDAETFTAIDFPIMPVVTFKIITMSATVLDISFTTSDGKEQRYYFKKLN